MAINTPKFTPNTGSQLDQGRTNSSLSTQIIVRVDKTPVGALQTLTVSQNRGLFRVPEIGTDGFIEIVPNRGTEITLSTGRIVFDQLRLPEAFSRGFRFIAAQRIAFDIDIYDITSVATPGAAPSNSNGSVVMCYKNCWFTRYDTPYTADNYLITETAELWAETAFITNLSASPKNSRGVIAQTDKQGIERKVNLGGHRGSLDYSGLFNSIWS